MTHFRRRSWLFPTFACGTLAALLPLMGRGDDGDRPGRKFALLVGVKSYPKGQGLGDLKYHENDVNDLAAVLKDVCGFRRVIVMTQALGSANADRLPTADNIRDNLTSLLNECKRGDTILVVFSGHGVQQKAEGGGDEAFCCPMDARPTTRKNLVALSDVYKQMDGSIADVKLLMADCCRNDAEGKGAGGDNLAPPEPPKGVAALFSCSKGQRSFESEEFKQGVFTHYVIEGLKGKAANKKGEVTLAGLADYVQDEVPDRVIDEQKSPQVHQVPNLVGDVSGKLTLAKGDAGLQGEGG